MTATVDLKMPLGYIDIESEEMEYLEGGTTILFYTIKPKVCNDISAAVGAGFGTASSLANVVPALGQIGSALLGVCAAVGAAGWAIAGNHKGMGVYYSTTLGFYVAPRW